MSKVNLYQTKFGYCYTYSATPKKYLKSLKLDYANHITEVKGRDFYFRNILSATELRALARRKGFI